MFAVTVVEKPGTANSHARGTTKQHRMSFGRHIKRWRQLGKKAAKAANVPTLGPTVVVVRLERVNRSGWPDVGSCFFEAKAIIDGCRDANVWPDDTPEWVVAECFAAPVVTGRHALTVELWPAETFALPASA